MNLNYLYKHHKFQLSSIVYYRISLSNGVVEDVPDSDDTLNGAPLDISSIQQLKKECQSLQVCCALTSFKYIYRIYKHL